MAFPANINLSSLDGLNGTKLYGSNNNSSGYSVASAGDINGDGFDDLVIGASGFGYYGGIGNRSGVSYVVFGKPSSLGTNIQLSDLDGRIGFKLTGELAHYSSIAAVGSAGDFNGDGFDDLVIGAKDADTAGSSSGVTYVVFGKASGFAASIDLSTLNGSDGFRLSGAASGSDSGSSVASAGDLNGDGFDDLIVGAIGESASYVVFGKASGLPATTNLSSLNGVNGFKLIGGPGNTEIGQSVASAGDINGDGFADLIIGARYANAGAFHSGASYVVFGKASAFPATFNLLALNGSDGFKLSGTAVNDWSGASVASAGDVNGDGYDDLIIGAPQTDPNGTNSGASYVVFGKASGFAANFNLSSLNGSNGFKLSGVAALDYSGWSVASAGDFNGDGFDDLIVSAWKADPNGESSGASYVVFGKTSGFAANVSLSSLNGSTGFKLSGERQGDRSGWSAASAGDLNDDGYDDLIIGAFGASGGGTSYVVYGKADGAVPTAPPAMLANLNGGNGFKMSGVAANDYAGASVASAGDINGDGYDDVIVGARRADAGAVDTGASYIVFGMASGFAANLDLSTLNGVKGFRLSGTAGDDRAGHSVSSAGDVNGDGYADLIIGAPQADPNGANSGASYVVFGKDSGFAANFDLSTLNGISGFKLSGAAAGDGSGMSARSAGDFNGDGFDDLIIGAPSADANGVDSGAAYIIYGKASGFASNFDLSTLNGSNGIRLSGASAGDQAGLSVASAGDFNGDGYDDVIVGARTASPSGTWTGASYVVFGRAAGGSAALGLSTLDGNTGFRLSGVALADQSGLSVASAGDLNGDGFADLIVGAPYADPNGNSSGASYVVFGKASGFAANFDLSTLNGSNGFKLSGAAAYDFSSFSVASAGDFNGDGFADLIVGARGSDTNGALSGTTYVVFGKAMGFAANIDLSTLSGSSGFKLAGVAAGDQSGMSVASAGDVNGDGYDDLIVGADRAGLQGGGQSGAAYVVFGGAFGAVVKTNGTAVAERLIGRAGDDVLTGGGGADVFHAGAGDDRLIVSDLTFRLADGGTGTDTLIMSGGGQTLDLSNPLVAAKLDGIERIDITGSGNNTLKIDQAAVLGGIGAVVGGRHVLVVETNPGDSVLFTDAGWTKIGSFVNADGSFDRWVLGNAEVDVERLPGFPELVALGSLDGSNGFKLTGEPGSFSGMSVASAGDVNGDGFVDLIIGAPYNGPHGSSVYVVFGKESAFDAATDLTLLDGSTGFRLSGTGSPFGAGSSVAAGDVNGDGFADLIVGTAADLTSAGVSYVMFGKAAGFAASIELASLTGASGFKLVGAVGENSGVSVASAGDINGDGYDDLIIGASYANGQANRSGASYVVFGKASGNADITLSTLQALNGSTGFKLSGASTQDNTGASVASAGDMNGDGFADLIVSARGASPNGLNSGVAYVVFGKAAGFASNLNLSTLNGSNGFKLNGAAVGDFAGHAVASAGDVNGDGFADVIVSALYADPNGSASGASYVVFGKAGGFGAQFELSTLNGSNGFKLSGVESDDLSGTSVASAGDVNGDGLDDLIIGAPRANPNGIVSGESYVVFGKASGFAANINLATLDGITGFTLAGAALGDLSGFSVAPAGDVNNDGFDDVIIGAHSADLPPSSYTTGASYVVFGGLFGASSAPVTTIGTSEAEILLGAAGDDVLTGGGGADVFNAGAGNDRIVVPHEAFRLADGGNGIDTLVFSDASRTLDLTTPRMAAKLDSIERIDLTGTGSNTLKINQAALLGGLGIIVGGKHVLTVEGNAGDAVLLNDVGWANAGSFTNASGTFDRYVLGNAEVDIERGVVLLGVTIEGTAGSDIISPSQTVSGQPMPTDRPDLLNGYGGNDTLDGGAGDDTMTGGDGDDTYIVDGAGDTVVEAVNKGSDTVHASVSHTLAANVENLMLTGAADLNGTGNGLANVLWGNAGKNLLDGKAGADTMAGGLGDDTYVVDNAGDVVTEAANQGTDTVESRVDWTLGANVERLVLAGTSNLKGTGNALNNALTGNTGNNVLDGGAGADKLAGGLGDDTYVVDAAGDVVTEAATQGTDTVNAWLGWTLGANLEQLKLLGTADIDGTGNSLDNVLTGNAGANVLNGGAGADTMTGGLGDDTYVVDNVGDVVVETANGGIDTVLSSVTWMLGLGVENLTLTRSGDIGGTGNALRNILTGNGGANLLDGGAGADTMAGGLGNDFYVVDNAGDVVTELAGGGIDTVRASVSHTLSDHVEKLVLLGSGHLRGTGNALANTLTGNDGNNVLDGQAGADTMAGGRGNDIYIVDNAGDVLGEGEGAGTDTVQSSVTWRLKDNFENLVLTGSADIDGTGNELANVLTGNDGNNLLDGGAGADTMAGGLGDDIYVVNAASDRISEAAGQGTDTVRAWATYRLQDNLETLVLMGNAALNGTGNGADNVILGNGGRNVLDGGAGADRMEGGAGNDTYVVDDAGDLVNESGGGIDEVRSWVSYTLTANVETLTLLGTGDLDGTGNGLANTLNGNGGANRLDGGSGADTMYGGAGDDTYVVDAPGDRVIERAGNGYDTVLSSVSHTLSAEVEKLVMTCSAAIDGGGNGAANVLIGNGANNVLDGGLGADAMSGGEGNDTYVVDNAGDVVTELANGGTDTVRSGISHTLAAHVENLTLTGKANIAATGNELANILTGNAGRNVLDGGLGADVLAGGGGGDTFRFSTALGLDNIDRILAFNHNADTIQLDHAVFAALGAGALAAGAFNLGPVATQADDRILFDAASKSLSYDADGLGGVDAVKFATIDTLQGGLDHTDFLIV